MSEQEREGVRQPEEAEVEGHSLRRRGEAEAPPDVGERAEEKESDEPDVEGHRKLTS